MIPAVGYVGKRGSSLELGPIPITVLTGPGLLIRSRHRMGTETGLSSKTDRSRHPWLPEGQAIHRVMVDRLLRDTQLVTLMYNNFVHTR